MIKLDNPEIELRSPKVGILFCHTFERDQLAVTKAAIDLLDGWGLGTCAVDQLVYKERTKTPHNYELWFTRL